MTKSIYKAVIWDLKSPRVKLQKGAVILHAGDQKELICIWYLCDTNEEEMEDIHLKIYGTGHIINESNIKYIGTVHMAEGSLIWHVFEELKVNYA